MSASYREYRQGRCERCERLEQDNAKLREELASLKVSPVVNQKLTLRELCEQIAEIVWDDELDYSHIDQFRQMQEQMRMKQGWTDCNVEANKQTLDFCRDVLDRRLI